MKIFKNYCIIQILLFLLFGNSSQGQCGIKYIYLETPVYDYFDYLINAGKFNPKFVLRQPYEWERDFLFNEQRAEDKYFKVYWHTFYHDQAINFHLNVGDHFKYDNGFSNRYFAEGGGHYSAEHITLANRTAIDQNYKKASYFAGDLSESDHWLYGRVNEAYMNLNFYDFGFFVGRMKRNWGPIGQKSLILSNNPYSYDHVLFNYKKNHFTFSVIYAQLEKIDAYNFDFPDSLIKNSKKYLVGHRLDVRFSDHFQIALTEMATYGGPNRNFELAFLNPLNFYYPIQRNDEKQMDGFWALDLFFKPAQRLTLYSQFLIDDIIVNNDPGINDRGQYPDRFGMMLSIRAGDFFINGLNSELTYNRIWNRTYQSKYTWENYHYRGLGLGYPCASCEELKFKLSYWNAFPFFIQQETVVGRYGSVELTDLFLLEKEAFPIRPVKHNLITTLWLKYFLNPSVTFSASIKYQDRIEHYSNRLGEKSHFIFSIGFNYLIGKSLTVD